MKLSHAEFIQLQKEWYQKLRESGFEDIERFDGQEQLVLIQAAYPLRAERDEFLRNCKAEYFRSMALAARDQDTVYRNEVDKYIIERYVDGANIKTIVLELKDRKMPRDRNSVRFIIRRYEMQWGLRHYSYKQLHIKIRA